MGTGSGARKNRAIPLFIALSEFRSQHRVGWNLTMAAVLFVLAVIIVFFLAQRAFIEGVTLTGPRDS